MENKKHILIIGAGGFGREVYQLINEINLYMPKWNILGFLDDNKSALDEFENYPPILGTINDYSIILCNKWPDSVFLITAIANPKTRKETVFSLNKAGAKWATLIHPTASIGTNSIIKEGSILARNSVISCDAKVGRHVHINMLTSCDHDVVIGDFCTISLNVDIQGGAQLGEGVFLGGGVSVLAKAILGEWSYVGALSLVTQEVNSKTTVVVIPAKILNK